MSRISKKNLVVGANSFLGAELISRISDKNSITGVYHTSTDKLIKGVNAIPVSELDLLKDDFDIVYILSAYIPSKREAINEQQLWEVNALLPERICKKFSRSRIVFASSVSVYAEGPDVLNEDSIPAANTLYGKSKMAGEAFVSRHPDHAIIRISSMYGEGMNESTFLPRIVISALRDGLMKIFGNGSRAQNYIHVGDVAEFFIRAAQSNSNNTYLAVAERSYSNLEVATVVKNALKNVKIELSGEDHSASFRYDGNKSYGSLDFKPQKNIEQGIIELIQWQQKKF